MKESTTVSDRQAATHPPRGEDFNRLVPRPWVEPVSQAQTDSAVVGDDTLVFPRAGNEDVLSWAAGRLVVSAPSVTNNKNPFGFARRVQRVTEENDLITVETTRVGLDEVIAGDMQATLDFAGTVEVDINGLDLGWLGARYYTSAAPSDLAMKRDVAYEPGRLPPGEPVQEGSSLNQPLLDFFEDISDAVVGVWDTVTGALLTGTVRAESSIGDEVVKDFDGRVLEGRVQKQYPTKDRQSSFVVFAEGYVNAVGSVRFDPGMSVRVVVPVVPGAEPFHVQADLEASFKADLDVDLDVTAGVRTEDGDPISGPLREEIENSAREALLGADVRPVGGFRRVIYLSKPRYKTVMAGPVPVVLVMTTQVDLECGAAVAGGLKSTFHVVADSSLDFWVRYDSDDGMSMADGPGFEFDATVDVESARFNARVELACGLIPRFNVFAYDAVGINAGLRGSLVGRLEYDEACVPARDTDPLGTTELSLAFNMGLQAGARLQAPGSSLGGTTATTAGVETVAELWNHEWELWSREYTSDGIGYCRSSCANGQLDPDELGVDCGGGCGGCPAGSPCEFGSDCAGALYCSGDTCSQSSCGDGWRNGDETDTDCGGSCAPCAQADARCKVAGDCAAGYCIAPRVVDGQPVPGKCTANHCEDGVQDADETGVDCGGSCRKCRHGEASSDPLGCSTAYWDGHFCTSNGCQDKRITPAYDETDVDCGGSCGGCGVGQKCAERWDCRNGLVCGTNGLCAESTCDDGIQGPGEVGVDCAGVCRVLCPINANCETAYDCQSGICELIPPNLRICAGPSCTDGIHNGDEASLDCGAVCPRLCSVGFSCRSDADCESGACSALTGRCASAPDSCADRARNGPETDVDCGGDRCLRCGDGRGCVADGDCADSLICVETNGVKTCESPRCANGLRDNNEGDVDCGAFCAPCASGRFCRVNADCASELCTGGRCAEACANGRRNPGETDVDCGGSCPNRCNVGQGCLSTADCAVGTCGPQGYCLGAGCTDQLRNGTETDVDCGGSCSPCADGKACTADPDCVSGACAGNLCAPPACDDGRHNGGETDVDCGGSCPAPCEDGDQCTVDDDCASGVCGGQYCSAPSCLDGVKNGLEMDVDCGYDECMRGCPTGSPCTWSGDCLSSVCNLSTNQCSAPACDDNRQNGDETDRDCGGSCTRKCAVDKLCVVDGDCESGYCFDRHCTQPTCTDNVRNGGESDVDCGGPCDGCQLGQACADPLDCATLSCTGGECTLGYSCTDGIRNGQEGDVDCGRGCPDLCTSGSRCNVPDDCITYRCNPVLVPCAEDPNGCPGDENACYGNDACYNGQLDVGESDLDCGGPACREFVKCLQGAPCTVPEDCLDGICGADNTCQAPSCTDGIHNGQEADVDCGGTCGPCGIGARCNSHAACTGGTVCIWQPGPDPSRRCVDGAIVYVGWYGDHGFWRYNFVNGLPDPTRADLLCQDDAQRLGLLGTVRYPTVVALVSKPESSMADQLIGVSGPFRRPDGALIAAGVSEFLSASHAVPMNLPLDYTVNSDGTTFYSPRDVEVWTGSTPQGTPSGVDCNEWMDGQLGSFGTVGLTSATDGAWAAAPNAGSCFDERGFYCLMIPAP
ncbi:MAG: hypothetical protein AB2A00_17945 [Myxococcota bacterium]